MTDTRPFEPLEEDANNKFTDQFWLSTEGHNDVRNKEVVNFVKQQEVRENKKVAVILITMIKRVFGMEIE